MSGWLATSLPHPIGFIALGENNIFDGPYEKVIDAKKVDGNFKLKVGTEARQASRRPAPPGHVMKHLFANYSRAIERVPCTVYEWFERP